MSENNGNGRVTNAQLEQAIENTKELITAQQRVEHVKTRGTVVVMGLFTGAVKIASIFGFLSVPFLHF